MISLQSRLHAAGVHLGISLLVAALAAALVFGVWYPYPYREISGGRELFVLLVCVDVMMGPLLTLAVFDHAKPRLELRRDLAVIGVLQLAALVYGVWTVFSARPVHLVFEIDRFRVVHAVDVPHELRSRAPAGVDVLPWTGPTLLALRPFRSEQEKVQATLVALQGVPLSARPDLWQSYDQARPAVLAVARSLPDLRGRRSEDASRIDRAVAESGRPIDGLAYLPLAGRRSFWTVLLDRASADVVGFIPLDAF
ncbi:TfpX/TfpZ family type IV pilin accessory protein [Pseudorhodoferax sp. Leaf274]|uniref:TfpX/TfpZ family type IV pilin accessory protein n=1 Tax=Pseudorhodoferax sp. Leaf274 TaxID=1736318 RepID=UPI000702D472|nr:TfpX/TfpZ family type IV pilin accessory protein [Pseudorhodoferax sp. Leaf274]KQP47688.1 pilus assembly protein [Pseudorhodoferax sp. Leaf274]